MATMINCPFCGKLTDPNLDSCVHCGGFLPKGQEGTPQRKAPARSQTCPNCGALVQEGDIICVACGTNLLTGQKIAEERPAEKKSQRNYWPWIIGAIAVVVLLIVLALIVVFLTGDAVAQAEQLMREGKTLEAANLLRSHLDRHPDSAKAYVLLGRIHWANRDYAAAAESFDNAAGYDPGDAMAPLYAGLNYALVRGGSSLSQSEDAFEEHVRRMPESAQGWYLLGQVRGIKGNTAGQITALKNALETEESAERTRTALGIANALAGDFAAANVYLVTDDASASENPDITAVRGLVAGMEGYTDAATQNLEEAVEGQTAFREAALTQLGMLMMKTGDFDSASRYFRRALSIDSTDSSARFFRALCLESQRLDTEALAEFQDLAQSEGEYAAQAAAQAANIYIKQGEPSLAMETIERAMNLGATGPVVYTIRGRIFIQLGQSAQAREALRQAVNENPEYAPARLENGLLYIQRGMFEEGVNELRAYLSLVDPELPDARAEEIQALIDQLRESMEPSAATAGNLRTFEGDAAA